MKTIFLFVIVGIFSGTIQASHLPDLQQIASEVPISKIDEGVKLYIQNETNESVDGLISHYALVQFEDLSSHETWYILDGYYELKSGNILFLDFKYWPDDKYWKPIENYRNYMPGHLVRYLLKANEICNPYDRSHIGIIRGALTKAGQFEKVVNYFKKLGEHLPTFITDMSKIEIIDPPKAKRPSPNKLLFTLREHELISELGREAEIKLEIIPSSRSQSNDEVRQTYIGITESCRQPGAHPAPHQFKIFKYNSKFLFFGLNSIKKY